MLVLSEAVKGLTLFANALKTANNFLRSDFDSRYNGSKNQQYWRLAYGWVIMERKVDEEHGRNICICKLEEEEI